MYDFHAPVLLLRAGEGHRPLTLDEGKPSVKNSRTAAEKAEKYLESEGIGL